LAHPVRNKDRSGRQTVFQSRRRAAEQALERYGKGRHPAGLNMGDCFSYAVAATANVSLLFKGQDFGQTDIKLHPSSSL
jgi:ribonuclease VapC